VLGEVNPQILRNKVHGVVVVVVQAQEDRVHGAEDSLPARMRRVHGVECRSSLLGQAVAGELALIMEVKVILVGAQVIVVVKVTVEATSEGIRIVVEMVIQRSVLNARKKVICQGSAQKQEITLDRILLLALNAIKRDTCQGIVQMLNQVLDQILALSVARKDIFPRTARIHQVITTLADKEIGRKAAAAEAVEAENALNANKKVICPENVRITIIPEDKDSKRVGVSSVDKTVTFQESVLILTRMEEVDQEAAVKSALNVSKKVTCQRIVRPNLDLQNVLNAMKRDTCQENVRTQLTQPTENELALTVATNLIPPETVRKKSRKDLQETTKIEGTIPAITMVVILLLVEVPPVGIPPIQVHQAGAADNPHRQAINPTMPGEDKQHRNKQQRILRLAGEGKVQKVVVVA
jgi:hypothetical protein